MKQTDFTNRSDPPFSKKRFSSRLSNLLIGLALLLIILGTGVKLLFGKADALEAVVIVKNQEVLVISLSQHEGTEQISLESYGVPASLEISENRIRFIRVDCPDHICENTGFIGKAYQSAVCMPNKAAVSIRPIQ